MIDLGFCYPKEYVKLKSNVQFYPISSISHTRHFHLTHFLFYPIRSENKQHLYTHNIFFSFLFFSFFAFVNRSYSLIFLLCGPHHNSASHFVHSLFHNSKTTPIFFVHPASNNDKLVVPCISDLIWFDVMYILLLMLVLLLFLLFANAFIAVCCCWCFCYLLYSLLSAKLNCVCLKSYFRLAMPLDVGPSLDSNSNSSRLDAVRLISFPYQFRDL